MIRHAMAPMTHGSADPPVRAGLAAEEEARHNMCDVIQSDRPAEMEGLNETPPSRAPRTRHLTRANQDFGQGEATHEHSAGKIIWLLGDLKCPLTSWASVHTVSTRLRRWKTPPLTAVGAVADRSWWRKIPDARFQALSRASSKNRTTETRARAQWHGDRSIDERSPDSETEPIAPEHVMRTHARAVLWQRRAVAATRVTRPD